MSSVTIYTGGKRSFRARQLDRLLAEHWNRAVMIVPTQAAARQRLASVLREHGLAGALGRPVMDFRSFTESLLIAEGEHPRKADDLRRRLALEGALRRLRETGALPDLPGPGAAPGLVAHLLDVITQLKQAALEPGAFRACAAQEGALSPLDALTAAAYEGYQDALKASDYYDVPGLYWRAHDLAVAAPPRALDGVSLLIFDGFDDFTPSEFRLLRALAPRVPQIAFGLEFDLASDRKELFLLAATTQRRLQSEFNATIREFEPLAPTRLSEHAASNIFWRARPPKCAGLADDLRIVPCIDAQHEAETMARRVRALLCAGEDPARIAVVYRNLAGVAPWLRAAFAEYQVPARIAAQQSLAESATGAYLLDLLRAGERWERESTAEVLAAPLFAPEGRPDPALSATAGIARRAMVLEGRAEWRARLEAYARLSESAHEVALAGVILAAVEQLGAALDNLPAKGSAEEHCAAVEGLLEALHARAAIMQLETRAAEELAALDGLLALLGNLATALEGRHTGTEFLRVLEQAVHETPWHVPSDSGGILCLDAANARHLEFDHVFFGGLNEGAVPQAPGTNAIYNEEQRGRLRGLGIPLERRDERAAREMALYHHVLALPRKGLVLSYQLNAGGREAAPSPFLVQTMELLTAERPEVLEAAPLADSFLPGIGTAASVREARNAAFAGAAAGREALFPEAARGAAIEQARYGGGEFNAHDGALADPQSFAVLAAGFDAGHLFSAAQIESYTQCPFQFFLRRVLGVEEEDAPEAEMGALLRGAIMHRVLQLFHEAYRGLAVAEIPAEDAAARMRALIEQVFEEQAWKAKAAPAGVVDAERLRMELLLGRYLAHAREKHGAAWKPALFELGFGPRAHSDADEIAPAFVLETAAGAALFSGRIDRVDEDGNRVRLVDYKTGGLPSAGDIRRGVSIQLALYALACEQSLLPGRDCVEAVYVRVGGAKEQQGLRGKGLEKADVQATAVAAIGRSIEGIRAGLFPPLPSVAACHGCTTAHVCRHELARIGRKAPPPLLAVCTPGEEEGSGEGG